MEQSIQIHPMELNSQFCSDFNEGSTENKLIYFNSK